MFKEVGFVKMQLMPDATEKRLWIYKIAQIFVY